MRCKLQSTVGATRSVLPGVKFPETCPRAFVLVAVLVVVLLASMVAVSLLFVMRAEESATSAMASSEQAWSTAMSGVEEVIRVQLSRKASCSY